MGTRTLVALIVLALVAPATGGLAAGGAAAEFSATSHRRFDDAEHWSKVFDAPEREAWQKPAEVVAALGLERGDTVADLGAGTGYFLPYLAAAVGETGTVYAVEVEPNLVVHLRARAQQQGWRQVIPVLASADNPRLPRAQVDVVLIVDTYHHLDERLDYLRALADRLERGGRVAVIDWKKGDLPEGPPDPHKLSREQVATEMAKAGYRLIDEKRFLPYQYMLVFRPESRSESEEQRPSGAEEHRP